MVEAITASYVHESDAADWTITVHGLGKVLKGKAPGIIAARDRVDQLVDKITKEPTRTVVHLLNGSALDFTATYMQARLTRTPEPEVTASARKTARARTAPKRTTTTTRRRTTTRKDTTSRSKAQVTDAAAADAAS